MRVCAFCGVAEKKIPSWVVMESQSCRAFLDNNPVAPYHTLVIPKAHFENILDVPRSVLRDVTEMTRQVSLLYQQKLGFDSFQIFTNAGPHSAQSVWHLHFHVLPRINGDSIKFQATPMPELVHQYPEMLKRLQ